MWSDGDVHVIVWTYRVAASQRSEFERAYGPTGDWAALFGRHEAYRGTELVRGDDGAYVTIDRWQSREDFDEFLRRWGSEYRQLDEALDPLTDAETLVVTGVSIDPPGVPTER